jgi:hypothetical protein
MLHPDDSHRARRANSSLWRMPSSGFWKKVQTEVRRQTSKERLDPRYDWAFFRVTVFTLSLPPIDEIQLAF